MTDPQLTPVQADLVNLLHEIGGVESKEVIRQDSQRSYGWTVKLVMVGDSGRKVEVLVDGYAEVEWQVVGGRL